MRSKPSKGFLLAPLFGALMAVGLVSMGGIWLYYSNARSGSDATRRVQTSAIFDQTAYALASESLDLDSDGYREPPAFTINASFAPTGGGIIPVSSKAPPLDGWGRAIGYCPFDNGASAGGNRIVGDSPGTPGSAAFILITAGANGKFETTCAQAKTSGAQGDDGFRLITETAQKQLAGGRSLGSGAYWKAAVGTTAGLPVGTVVGEVRVTLDNGALNQWNGTAWSVSVNSSGGISPWSGVSADSTSLGSCTTDGAFKYSMDDHFFWKCSSADGGTWQAEDLSDTGGSLWAWGNNNNGQLGLGDLVSRSSPVQVGALSNWKTTGQGCVNTIAIKTDGTLWSWGYNSNGELGLGNTTNNLSPVQVGILTNWKQVITEQNHSLAVKTDGTLWAWGFNIYGQLGLGDTANRSSPVQVGTLNNWKQVSGTQYSFSAIKTDGTLWSWGNNYAGQLGLGNAANRSSPVQIGALSDWKQVSGGGTHYLALKINGTLWSWGDNSYGQLGQGDVDLRSSPVQVGNLTNWQQISGGLQYGSIAKQTNGTLWSWGRNNYGQLGLGDLVSRSSPVQVGALTNWQSISAGLYHTTAVKTNGTLWSWGKNNYGQLGLGDVTNRSSPVQVGALTNWKKSYGGFFHTLAIQEPTQ